MRGCIKVVLIAVGLVLIAMSIGTIYLFMQADAYSRTALERTLHFALGVDIAVGRLEINPFEQRLDAYDVVISNPPKFKPGTAIEIQRLSITFDASTLFARNPTIRSLSLQGVRLNLHHEMGNGTNLVVLARQAADPNAPANAHGRSFVLKEIRCEDARMRASTSILPIGSAGMTLAPFVDSDLGDKPVSVGEITSIFTRKVLHETLSLKGILAPVARLLQDEPDAGASPPKP